MFYLSDCQASIGFSRPRANNPIMNFITSRILAETEPAQQGYYGIGSCFFLARVRGTLSHLFGGLLMGPRGPVT